MNTHGTRNENILYLVLTSAPDLFKNLSVSYVLGHSDHLNVTVNVNFTIRVDFSPSAARPKFIFYFTKSNKG